MEWPYLGRKSSLVLWAFWACLVVMVPERTHPQPPPEFRPQYSYLVDCGGVQTIDLNGRQWTGDNSPSFHFLSSADAPPVLASAPTSITFNSTALLSSLSPLLSTARIFTTPASYSFPVSPNNRYWLRLYFFPFQYEQFDPSSAVFSVTAGQITLLHEANIMDAIRSSTTNLGYLFKEYCINVTQDSLSVQFTPESSYAFINAIEVVSVPVNLITDTLSPLGMNSPKEIGMPYITLETMFRVNVGGPLVTPMNDSAGLYRLWLADESFLFSSAGVEHTNSSLPSVKYVSPSMRSIAPPSVYSTALEASTLPSNNAQTVNLSWVFSIDADYAYMVRLHFCDVAISTGGKRHFNVYLQNQTAYTNLDLGQVVQPNGAYYRDFYLDKQTDISSLWIQAGPPPNSDDVLFNRAIVNGIEVWKLNNTGGSVDGLASSGTHSSHMSKSKLVSILGAIVGGISALGLLLFAVCLLLRCKRKSKKNVEPAWVPLTMHGMTASSLGNAVSIVSQKSGTGSQGSSVTSSLGRVFSFVEISAATHNFDESRVVGEGGFGKVYLGELDDGLRVAVKRGNPQSEQGITEFQTEIDMLSKLRHRHLVSLIGYCEERREMILVYEYMANGTLRSHLYGSDLPALSWMQRLEICIGAARGLHYLHTGASQSIIHRDVKTTNILLDDNFVAKVADFGLSKTGPTLDRTHVTTAVKGSFGYLDPEYFRRQQLTEKSDVYSFGVVLLEVLCARSAINPALPREEVNIAEWAMRWKSMGRLEQIIDCHLAGSINPQSLIKYGDTAEKCLADEGVNRPTIGDVLWNLEYCLQLQETSMANAVDDDSTNRISNLPIVLPVQQRWEETALEDHSLAVSEASSEDATASAVFSHFISPRGR